jgi:trigger factor
LVEDRSDREVRLEAKGEEMDAFAKRYVSRSVHAIWHAGTGREELQQMAARMLGDREQIKRMRDTIVEQKLMVHFKTCSAQGKVVSFDEFVNLARTA